MVEFSVFNELSLPFKNNTDIEKMFIDFFKLLKKLQDKNLTQVRMDKNFKNYSILENITFQKFFGQLHNSDTKDKLREFITNGIIKIDSPLIKDEEIENHAEAIENEYFYNGQSTFGGLACCDIWNTIAISFNSSDEWDKNIILLQKNTIDINIRHASNAEHLDTFQDFFEDLEKYKKLDITQNNFWERKEEFFPNKIIFSKEVEKQIKDLDKRIFQHAIGILRGIETDKKPISHLAISNEGDTVTNNPFFRSKREFTLFGKKEFFEKHIKNFPNDKHRIHFLEKDNKIYIGYIGKHLPNKRDK